MLNTEDMFSPRQKWLSKDNHYYGVDRAVGQNSQCWWLGPQAIGPLGSGGPRTQQEGVRSLGPCSSRGFGPLIPLISLSSLTHEENSFTPTLPFCPDILPCHRSKSQRDIQSWTETLETENQSKSSLFIFFLVIHIKKYKIGENNLLSVLIFIVLFRLLLAQLFK